jgi:parallel beta-helix repeat protein
VRHIWSGSNVVASLSLALALVGCAPENGGGGGGDGAEPFDESCTTTVAPRDSPEASTTALEEAFISSEEGSVICMTDGTYEVRRELNLTESNITLRGQSQEGTVLDFAPQEMGANGILVQAEKNFAALDFTIKNTLSDALKVKGMDGVVMKNVTVTWDRGPSTKNGAYALYPVESENVLIEGCVARNARDAGIYLGQSEDAIIRDNEAYQNVVGIEIENTFNAEAYDNTAEGNADGFLIINLPNLMVKGGGKNLVYDNTIVGNNHENFGQKGTAVSKMPQGSGIVVVATDNNEIRDNTVRNNQSIGLALGDYTLVENDYDDEAYDPTPEGNWIHDNEFSENGSDPRGDAQIAQRMDGTAPQLYWDGRYDDSKDNSDGSLTNCFSGNVDGSESSVDPVILDGTTDCPDPPSDAEMCSIDCSKAAVESVTLPDRVYEMAGDDVPEQ